MNAVINPTVPTVITMTGSVPDGDSISIISVGTPAKGTVAFTDTTITYKAAKGLTAIGIFQFTYTISDGKCGTATGTITVAVA